MSSPVVWRWILIALSRSPLVWVAWTLLLLSVPLVRGLQPFPSSRTAVDIAHAWSLPAGLVGTVCSLCWLSRGRDFLARIEDRDRFVGEAGALLAAALYLQLPVLAGTILTGVGALDLGRSLTDILTADLRLAGLALLLIIPPMSNALRAGSFLGAAWLVPALCAHGALPARLTGLLDPGATLRVDADGARISSLVSGIALLLIAYLLRTGGARHARS